jgi:hypothetical protein
VAVAHPALRLLRIAGQHVLVDGDRLGVFADPRQGGGLQVEIGRIARLLGQQVVQLGQGRLGAPQPVGHGGQVVAGGGEAGGDLQATDQQGLGLLLAAQPGDGLGQHPDRRRLVGTGRQQGAQDLLGLAGLFVDQGGGGGHQHRVADPALDLPGPGASRAVGVADQLQGVGQAAPGLGQFGLGGDGALERGDGGLGLAGGGQDQAVLQLDRRRLGEGPRQGVGHPQGLADVARQPQGRRQDERRLGMARHGLQHRHRLLGGQAGVLRQQPLGVGQGGGDAAGGLGGGGGRHGRMGWRGAGDVN